LVQIGIVRESALAYIGLDCAECIVRAYPGECHIAGGDSALDICKAIIPAKGYIQNVKLRYLDIITHEAFRIVAVIQLSMATDSFACLRIFSSDTDDGTFP
jgi:hypothetical protein